MAVSRTSRLASKRVVGEDSNILHAASINVDGAMLVRGMVWDVDTLDWVFDTGGSSTTGGAATEAEAYEQVAYDVDSDPMYTGALKADGSWYITKITGGRKTFITGSSGFVAAWANRATHSYDEYDVEF